MDIECTFETYIDSGFYVCIVVSTFNNSTSISLVNGEHEAGKTNSDVEAIFFQNIAMECFPRGLNKFFPNLKRLKIFNCGLKEVSKQDLIGLENLTHISFKSNSITFIENDLFHKMSNLVDISFNSNKIEFLSSKLFAPIDRSNLKYVGLCDNPTLSAFYSAVPKDYGSSKSRPIGLHQLMALIDETCKCPPFDTSKDEDIFTLLDEFQVLRISMKLTDFAIVVGIKEFAVHKIVLAAQSSAFEAMFERETEKKFYSSPTQARKQFKDS